MNPSEVARQIIDRLALPRGAVSVMPWHESGKVVLHVLVDRQYVRSVTLPPEISGYEVQVEERTTATMYRH